MQAALDQLRTEGYPVQEEALAYLSPARFEYLKQLPENLSWKGYVPIRG